ncbi:MAG: SMC family ATPase [Dehalococcoidales bacterium]|nr:SMC family ATPase [Dehalococcoidales bacterium]
MIPIQLKLRNFMCYRDNVPPINFESIHTACISGNNGNGKSALIDAMTWALWGKTRASSDDELIHTGQTEAEVQFDFAQGQERYRVIRKRSRPRSSKSSGQSILEFQVSTPDGFKVLTGDSIDQTQRKIINILHMDYETFINSAFLKQGRADEFTKKRPGERKEILGNILQLSVYDELEQIAREHVREIENQISIIDTSLKNLQDEIDRKTLYEAEYEQVKAELIQVDSRVHEIEQSLSSLRKKNELLENRRIQLSELELRIRDTEHNYRIWQDQVTLHRSRIIVYEELLARRSEIEQKYRNLIENRRLCDELDQKYRRVNSLTQAKHKLEMAILKASEKLNELHAITADRIRELQSNVDRLPQIQAQIRQIDNLLLSLAEKEAEIESKKDSLRLAQARIHFLQAEQTRLTQEIEQLEEKLKLLAQQKGGTCPLCESPLGEDGQKRIETRYQADKTRLATALSQNKAELQEKEAEARALEHDIISAEKSLKTEKDSAQSQKGRLSKTLNDINEASTKLADEKSNLSLIEEKLARKDFALEEQNTLSAIEQQIRECAYDPQQHEMIKNLVAEMAQYEEEWRKLQEAERLIVEEKEAEAKALKTAETLVLNLENDSRRKNVLLNEIQGLTGVADELASTEKAYREISAKQKSLQESLGAARARLERLAELSEQYRQKENQRKELAKQMKIYQELSVAFGKNGIQAMLIETAIPEIEAEANKLLSRMTDNRMHVKVELQKPKKTGGTRETLDIVISDELDTRPYEMFSGGEAFRIDFAIRIALSKLLARRAGAPLPILIIDEGFGTQDSTGIEKIKEAITSIQDDFQKILVITHIADFKDAFPVRIEVVKTPEGSSIIFS